MKKDVLLYVVAFLLGVGVVVVGYVFLNNAGKISNNSIDAIDGVDEMAQYEGSRQSWEEVLQAIEDIKNTEEKYSDTYAQAYLRQNNTLLFLDRNKEGLDGFLDIINDKQYSERRRLAALLAFSWALAGFVNQEKLSVDEVSAYLKKLEEGGFYVPTGEVVSSDTATKTELIFDTVADINLFLSKRYTSIGREFDSLYSLSFYIYRLFDGSSQVFDAQGNVRSDIQNYVARIEENQEEYKNFLSFKGSRIYVNLFYYNWLLYLEGGNSIENINNAFDNLSAYIDRMDEVAQSQGFERNYEVSIEIFYATFRTIATFYNEYGVDLKNNEEVIERIKTLLNKYVYTIHPDQIQRRVYRRNVSKVRDAFIAGDVNNNAHEEENLLHYLAYSYIGTYIDPQLKNFLINDVGIVDGVGWREDDFRYSEEQYEQWLGALKELKNK